MSTDISEENPKSSADNPSKNNANSDKLVRTAISSDTVFRHFMHLPKLPNKPFEIRPHQSLPDCIVDEEYGRIWTADEDLGDIELNTTPEEEEKINNGIPTKAMAAVATRTMRWDKLVQAGMCTATYANDKFITQLTNSAVVAALLSGFATAAVIEAPGFTDDSVYSHPIPEVFQCSYSVLMIASALYCFAATAISLHSINRISNVLPSKSSVAYMTINVFYDSRDAVNDYLFKGMATACGGIIVAFVWLNQNIYNGIPAAVVCGLACGWFITLYKQWDKMTTFHSDVADKLCARDMLLSADKGTSITEGLWSV